VDRRAAQNHGLGDLRDSPSAVAGRTDAHHPQRSSRGARPPTSTLIDYIDAHREQFGIERLIREIGLAGACVAFVMGLQPADRRLALLDLAAHRPGRRRPRTGPLAARPRRPRGPRAHSSLGQGLATCPCATPTGSTPPAPSARWAARATATTAAESLIGLYKTELIRRRGPWKGLGDVELATLEYVDWFNHRRLHSACGDIPPVEFEDHHYRSIAGLTEDTPAEPSLH
jgi:hypothetical protein